MRSRAGDIRGLKHSRDEKKREKRRSQRGRGRGRADARVDSEVRALFMMLSPKAAALSDRGFCPTAIALPVPYVALISSEGTLLFPRPTLGVILASSRMASRNSKATTARRSGELFEFEVTREDDMENAETTTPRCR